MYTQEIVCPKCAKMTSVNVLEAGGGFFGKATTSTPCAHCKSTIHVAVNSEGKVTKIDYTSSGCLIATALYGSSTAPEVRRLRAFRDKQLDAFELGRLFIASYYRTSPGIAEFIQQHPSLKRPLKVILIAPIVRVIGLLFPE